MALGTAALGTAALGTAALGTAALGTAALGTAALGTAALGTAALGHLLRSVFSSSDIGRINAFVIYFASAFGANGETSFVFGA